MLTNEQRKEMMNKVKGIVKDNTPKPEPDQGTADFNTEWGMDEIQTLDPAKPSPYNMKEVLEALEKFDEECKNLKKELRVLCKAMSGG